MIREPCAQGESGGNRGAFTGCVCSPKTCNRTQVCTPPWPPSKVILTKKHAPVYKFHCSQEVREQRGGPNAN